MDRADGWHMHILCAFYLGVGSAPLAELPEEMPATEPSTAAAVAASLRARGRSRAMNGAAGGGSLDRGERTGCRRPTEPEALQGETAVAEIQNHTILLSVCDFFLGSFLRIFSFPHLYDQGNFVVSVLR